MQPDIKNLRFRSRTMAPLLSLLLLLCSCDPGVRYVVTRRALLGDGCPDGSRNYVIMGKLSCCPEREPWIREGRIILGADEDRRKISDSGEHRMKHSSDYVDVFGGALGSGEVWARLRVSCPSTGTVIYDSGEIRREDAFCKQGDERWSGYLFLFEGHARRKEGDSCCPGNLTCPR